MGASPGCAGLAHTPSALGTSRDASVLCVGAGTGAEVLYLAREFPGWRFTAVEPSEPMLDRCRQRAAEAGIQDRCCFHLPPSARPGWRHFYGVHLGGAFFGESIFNRVDDAGKAALVHLAGHLRERGFKMLEIQMVTPLTAQIHPRMVGKREYARLLASAISVECEW